MTGHGQGDIIFTSYTALLEHIEAALKRLEAEQEKLNRQEGLKASQCTVNRWLRVLQIAEAKHAVPRRVLTP
jgi:hypothetical protein